jgi:hypothetical protein
LPRSREQTLLGSSGTRDAPNVGSDASPGGGADWRMTRPIARSGAVTSGWRMAL